MTTTYRPCFSYAPDGLRAHQILERFGRNFQFLPAASSEPDLASALISDLIAHQSGVLLERRPQCPHHGIDLVFLGELGEGWFRPKRKRSLGGASHVGKRGVQLRKGIFRCPVPGCVHVDTPDSKDGECGPIRCAEHL